MENHREDEGRAYAFFNCRTVIDEIRQELPVIRKRVETPVRLRLTLEELSSESAKREGPTLREILTQARQSGIRYFMEARSPGQDNKATAVELSAILNQIYQTPLYEDGEEFTGAVVYKERGAYHFLE